MISWLIKAVLFSQGYGFGSNSIKNEVMTAKKFVNGGCFFDVGCNKGVYARELLKVFDSQLQSFHCFEPSKKLVSEYLTFNDPRVRVNPAALGARKSVGKLFKVRNQPGLNSLTKRRLDHFNLKMDEKETVNIVTLDDYAKSQKINRIDFIKLDVEGHELEVLKGGTKLFEKRAIQCIQFEFGGCNIDTRTYFQDFWYLLKDKIRYTIYRITPFGAKKVNRYRENDEIFLTTNYIAVLDQ